MLKNLLWLNNELIVGNLLETDICHLGVNSSTGRVNTCIGLRASFLVCDVFCFFEGL